MLVYFGVSLEEVVKLYETELGFERGTARGQVQAQQNSPGYFTCYYYGMKKICGWRRNMDFPKRILRSFSSPQGISVWNALANL